MNKISSNQWLDKSFQQNVQELDALGYKPPEIVINEDPHFVKFKPSFNNGEIRQILIGGNVTLETGYQFNMTNIAPWVYIMPLIWHSNVRKINKI